MESTTRLNHIVQCLLRYPLTWLIPAVLGLGLSTVYAFVLMEQSWTARQSMILRDDLLGDTFKPGQFLSEEAMKSAQETILETARRPEVIRETLKKIGPQRKSFFGNASSWPSAQAIEDARGAVTFQSANGGDFGTSEVIILAAKSSNPDRATKFLTVLLDEVDTELTKIRAERFSSMKNELKATRDRAYKAMEERANALQQIESKLGADVMVIKDLVETGGSPSAFDNNLMQIKTEKREAIRQLSSATSLKNALIQARRSPDMELPTTGDLINMQPTFAGLLTSLAKARQNLAEAEGRYFHRHPAVQNGKATVAAMKKEIVAAAESAIEGLDGQIRMLENSVKMLDGRIVEYENRVRRLSGERVQYMSLEQEVQRRSEDLHDASTRLAEVEARSETAGAVQLLTRMGEPYVGTRADGIGKKGLALLGGIAGLIGGLGLLMLIAPPFESPDQPSAVGRQVASPPPAPATSPTPASTPSPVYKAPDPAPRPKPAPPAPQQPAAQPASAIAAAPAPVRAFETQIKPTPEPPTPAAAPTPILADRPPERVTPAVPATNPMPAASEKMNAAQLAAEIINKQKEIKAAATPVKPPGKPTPAPKTKPATAPPAAASDKKADFVTIGRETIQQKPAAAKPGNTNPDAPLPLPSPSANLDDSASKLPGRSPADTIAIDQLPLSRRKPENVRPLDLAKSAEQPQIDLSETPADGPMIDKVFSKLETDRKPREVKTVTSPEPDAEDSKTKIDPLASQTVDPVRREIGTAIISDQKTAGPKPPPFVPRRDIKTVDQSKISNDDVAPQAENFERQSKPIESATPPAPPSSELSIPDLIQRLKGSRAALDRNPGDGNATGP